MRVSARGSQRRILAAVLVVACAWTPVPHASAAEPPQPSQPPAPGDVPPAPPVGGVSITGPGAVSRRISDVPRVAATGATPLGDYGCVWQGGMVQFNPASQVMQDKFTMSGFAPYDVGTQGNMNWALDPYRHPTWIWGFHTLSWIRSLVDATAATGDRTTIDRAGVIVRDWVADNPIDRLSGQPLDARAHRANSLLCMYAALGPEPWLVSAMQDHARLLIAHYSGAFNHGLDESIALLGLGCELGDRTVADVAVKRIADMGPIVVDAQGVTNEQSVGYHEYNHRRFVLAERKVTDCGYQFPAEFKRRRDLMPVFMAHATKPDGTMVQLGDTQAIRSSNVPGTAVEYPATLGASGVAPTDRVRLYDAGFVLGRNTWAPFGAAYHYSLRFGPPPQIHGHADHMSVTYFARGRNILTEAGHVGYEPGLRREWIKSSAGHNVLAIPGITERRVATRLTRSSVTDKADFFEVVNDAYADRRRWRSVLVVREPQVMVVLDRATSPTTQQFQQLWHLPRDMTATVLSRGVATAVPKTAAGGSTRIYVIQVPLPGQVLPPGSTQVVVGRTSPSIQGFVSPLAYEWDPAPTVMMSRIGRATTHLTLIVPTRLNGRVGYSIVRGSDGWYRLSLDVAGVVTTIRISGGGWMSAA